MDINDLEFQVTFPEMSWTKNERRLELTVGNIFDYGDAKKWIAEDILAIHADKPTKRQQYLLKQIERDTQEQRLFHYFGFCWSRVQWEMNISRAFENEPSEKICVFDLFLRPNASLLLSMIDSVSVRSAKKYLRDWRKTHSTTKKRQLSTRDLYEPDADKIILHRTYQGYNYEIRGYHGHPTAYVQIPRIHPFEWESSYDRINNIFEEKCPENIPHGWFTYFENGWLGWDYAHMGDFVNNGLTSHLEDKRWTIEEISEDARRVIEGLCKIAE